MTELHVSPDWLGLRGQVFAVTGAASGIGEAIATALAQQGPTSPCSTRSRSAPTRCA